LLDRGRDFRRVLSKIGLELKDGKISRINDDAAAAGGPVNGLAGAGTKASPSKKRKSPTKTKGAASDDNDENESPKKVKVVKEETKDEVAAAGESEDAE
jgi:hypothetical protein